MIFYNNSILQIDRINIFGGGQIYTQIRPLLNNDGILVETIYDDTRVEKESNILLNPPINKMLLYCVGYKNMAMRYERYIQLKDDNLQMLTYIAPNAIFSNTVTIGNGSIINQGAIVDNFVNIGECVFVNIGAIISHDAEISDNVFIAPGVSIAGFVKVNKGVFLGINSTIIDGITIGEGALVAGGSVVTKNVEPYTMVAGNPAVIKKRLR
jgi:sugar O-acyltransferase (sialic acid O-acetyltransferase NeuD family)